MIIKNQYKEFINSMGELDELVDITKYLNSGILPKSISGSGYYIEDPRMIKQLFDEIIFDLRNKNR